MIKVVIFDFDGVIVDSVAIKSNSFIELFLDQDDDIKKKIKYYIETNPGIHRLTKFQYIYENIIKKPITSNIERMLSKKFSKITIKKVISSNFIKGAKEFLKNYSKEYNCYVVSATLYDDLKIIIKNKDIEKYFVDYYGMPNLKYKAIQMIKKIEKIENSEILYIGDTNVDYEAAIKTKINFLGINKDDNNIFPTNVDILKDLNNLQEYIKGI